MEALVLMLPVAWQPKMKSILVGFFAVVTFLLTFGHIVTSIMPVLPPWFSFAMMVLTTIGVYAVPNVNYQASKTRSSVG